MEILQKEREWPTSLVHTFYMSLYTCLCFDGDPVLVAWEHKSIEDPATHCTWANCMGFGTESIRFKLRAIKAYSSIAQPGMEVVYGLSRRLELRCPIGWGLRTGCGCTWLRCALKPWSFSILLCTSTLDFHQAALVATNSSNREMSQGAAFNTEDLLMAKLQKTSCNKSCSSYLF